MPEVCHTWLFEPARWRAEGRFWEGGAIARTGRGVSIVRHAEDVWTIEGAMEIAGDPPWRVENVYRIDPSFAGRRVIPWRSRNPILGALEGTFALAGDSILSLFRTADGRLVGSECLTRLAADRYRARGVLAAAGEVASTWAFELAREDDRGGARGD